MKHPDHSGTGDPSSKTREAPERQTAHETEADAGADLPNNTEKDPNTWTTGDESMTGAQASYLKTLSD